MTEHLLAYDLGTGGVKASLYSVRGDCRAACLVPYPTAYPQPGWHEQKPLDWWKATVAGTRILLADFATDRQSIVAIGISGHSLGVVPVDRHGRLLRESVPIWSDSRPETEQIESFFASVPSAEWYGITGNGFPPPLYSVFKIMWLRRHENGLFNGIHKVLGTKDYLNLRLTGVMATDHSYASGSGVYSLGGRRYSDQLLAASELPPELFPEIVPATQVLGELTAEAAEELGLPRRVKVVAGGVDNSCMALGAGAFREGRCYNSLGSSSWIAVSSVAPLLDVKTRPFVFAHVVPGLFASAMSIFSAGTSFRWVRDQFCQDLVSRAERENRDAYDLMTDEAARAPAGANGVIFLPHLAGGSSLEPSPNLRGAFIGLGLGHTRADLIRAAMEGVAMGLRNALDALRRLTAVGSEMLIVGGGARSSLWRTILADVYDMAILKTPVDQQAAALGAASLAAVGTGLWPDFDTIDDLHAQAERTDPDPCHRDQYAALLPVFLKACEYHARLGEQLTKPGRTSRGVADGSPVIHPPQSKKFGIRKNQPIHENTNH